MNIGRSGKGPYYREMASAEAGTGKTGWQIKDMMRWLKQSKKVKRMRVLLGWRMFLIGLLERQMTAYWHSAGSSAMCRSA